MESDQHPQDQIVRCLVSSARMPVRASEYDLLLDTYEVAQAVIAECSRPEFDNFDVLPAFEFRPFDAGRAAGHG